jgi:hypothetical protein
MLRKEAPSFPAHLILLIKKLMQTSLLNGRHVRSVANAPDMLYCNIPRKFPFFKRKKQNKKKKQTNKQKCLTQTSSRNERDISDIEERAFFGLKQRRLNCHFCQIVTQHHCHTTPSSSC